MKSFAYKNARTRREHKAVLKKMKENAKEQESLIGENEEKDLKLTCCTRGSKELRKQQQGHAIIVQGRAITVHVNMVAITLLRIW